MTHEREPLLDEALESDTIGHMDRRWLTPPLSLLCAVLAAPALLGLAALSCSVVLDKVQRFGLPLDPDPIPFESQRWRGDTQGFREIRLAMQDDLVASRVLIGKTRRELEGLIGTGDSAKDYTSLEIRPPPSPSDLVFSVGCRDLSSGRIDPFGIDCSYIVVRFGADGRVAAADVLNR